MKTLTNPTDEQLNHAFAVNVCGMTPNAEDLFEYPFLIDFNRNVHIGQAPKFTTSADAVLPWLLKTFVVFSYHTDRPDGRFQFCADTVRDGRLISTSGDFPRAAVLALLEAHGITVEFTP